MRFCTLICLAFLAITANCQTKDVEFKKLEDLLKKSIGVSADGTKVIDQVLNENAIKLDYTEEGKVGSIVCSNLNWDGFDYSLRKAKDNETGAVLTLTFDKNIKVTRFENSKQVEKIEADKMVLLFRAADVKQLRQQLEDLQTFTWKTLNEVRVLDKSELANFLAKKLNKALEANEAKVKSISGCEIIIRSDNTEITLPTKKLNLHAKKFGSDDYFFCYGKATGEIKIKENDVIRSNYVEHPELSLNFKDLYEVEGIEYAIRRLADICSL